MRFRLLGPIEVRDSDGTPIEVSGAKPRALLTLLLAEPGRVVSVDRIAAALWGDAPPPAATATLHSYVSQLRRLLGRELIVTRTPGYLAAVDPADVDLARLPTLMDEAVRLTAAGNHQLAAKLLTEAVDLWRGEPLAGLPDEAGVAAERARLGGLLLLARERRAAAWTRCGRAAEAVTELELLTAEHPLRESLWAALIEALYAAGRQADALDAYRRCARALADELGIDPGPQLRALEQAVLRQDAHLPGMPAAPTAPAGPPPSAGHGSSAASGPPAAAGSWAAPSSPGSWAAPGMPNAPAAPDSWAAPSSPGSWAAPAMPSAPAAPDSWAAPGSLGQPAAAGPQAAAGSLAAAGSPAEWETERPLVGRRAEQSRLRALLGEVARGTGAVMVLEGEAGIGKTRLAEAASALAGAQGWRSVWSRCADDDGVPPLWPWLQVLDRLDGGGLQAAAAGDPDQSTFALFQELRRRLGAAAGGAPLLIVLDDVQAADATSLSLLAMLARHLDGVRLLLVVTVRTVGEELAPEVVDCLAALAREPRAQRLQLTGLTVADVRELITARDGAARPDTAAALHARTDGNPFFVGELVELLHADGDITALPPSVRDVLDRRLTRLGDGTVALLRLAAVIGRDADLGLLQAASGTGAEEVITRLEPAVEARVLRADEASWRWRFSHALVRETLLAGLSRIESARLHARVAEALPSPADVERLAHHYFHAVPVTGIGPAVEYAGTAAAVARERHAHAEAATYARRALALLGPHGDPAERQRLLVLLGEDLLRAGRLTEAQEVVAEAIETARRLGDHERLARAASVWGGVTLWNWRGYGVVDEALVGLLEDLARQAGDHDRALRARLFGTLSVELAYSDRRDDRVRYAETAVELARDLDDPALLGHTLNNYVIATWGCDDRETRWQDAVAETLRLSGRGLPVRTEFVARLHRGPLLLHLGDAAGFAADLAAATRLGARLTGPDVQPHLFYQETGRAMLAGRWAEAERLSVQVYELYRTTSLWGAQFCRLLHQFTFRRQDGRIGEVVDQLVAGAGELDMPMLRELAVVAAAESGDVDRARRLRSGWPDTLPLDWTTDTLVAVRAWTALALGEDLTARYEQLLPYRGRQLVVGTAGACWGSYDLLLGRLAHAMDRRTEAADHLAAAARQGEQVGSPWQKATAESLLTRL
ncbi:AAA family ATPase [Actinoplanes sp. NBC_00393]|uniref:BTAD domain-containing putative transcriptional regulator n=1 Tax=Actinoplanes sp. NBC_00393 TaxID=2975953 RepID=UPI002E202E7F